MVDIMMLRIGSFVGIVFAIVAMTGDVSAAALNMMVDDDQTLTEDSLVFGVNVSNRYYSVVVLGGEIKKVELDGTESAEFVIDTDTATVKEFAERYAELSWLDKAQYLINRFGVPTHIVIEYAGKGAEDYLLGDE